MLGTRNGKGTLEIRLRFCRIGLRGLEFNFPGNAMRLGLTPFFLRNFYFVYRPVNATPSIVKLAKFRISHRQMR